METTNHVNRRSTANTYVVSVCEVEGEREGGGVTSNAKCKLVKHAVRSGWIKETPW